MRIILATVFAVALSLAAGGTPWAYGQDAPPAQSSAMTQVSSSGHIYIIQPVSNSVFIRARNMSLLSVLAVPATPSALAADPLRRRVYVASDAAGMISVIDDRTYRVIHIYAVGGHPRGLALLDQGRTLLVSDGVSGDMEQFSPLAAASKPRELLTIGPAAASTVELTPRPAAMGGHVLAWARGFSPGEPVEVFWVSWGARPLARVRANPAGIVTIPFQAPSGISLGQHLVILYGQWSTTSESTLLDVIHAPPTPKIAHRAMPPRPPSLLQRLLAPSITLPLPFGGAARHPRHGHGAATAPPAHAGLRIPVLFMAGALPPLLGLIVLRGRRRRKARKAAKNAGKKGQKGGGAAAAPPLKKAS